MATAWIDITDEEVEPDKTVKASTLQHIKQDLDYLHVTSECLIWSSLTF